ncbi:hypothetical protein EHQ24_18860 [Leptospira noumeaensis]|uniref:Uncharacterized protein n=1 Tax=Leptospira noumeaensis TaxID=2484964 RepID=A0A4R9HZA5_9LEPT|nr:hypothetical protein [Leptospira noumeaensis]TGK77679.1 hypothetical protein EHQ24_18860 [Leptospira noumeaensis]
MVQKALPRLLTEEETTIILWLLKNSPSNLTHHINNIANIIVQDKCKCGCASIDFLNRKEYKKSNLTIISDFKWKDNKNNLFGIFLFEVNSKLAGLEVYSIDGNAETPKILPNIQNLQRNEN